MVCVPIFVMGSMETSFETTDPVNEANSQAKPFGAKNRGGLPRLGHSATTSCCLSLDKQSA